MISLIISVIVLLYIFFLSIYPPQSAKDFPEIWNVVNESNEVARGNRLYYEVRFTKLTNKPAAITVQFVDGFIIILPEQISNLPKGKIDTISSVEVPKNMPAGEYYLLITIIYDNNIVNKDIYTMQTERFMVL